LEKDFKDQISTAHVIIEEKNETILLVTRKMSSEVVKISNRTGKTEIIDKTEMSDMSTS
jgi:hypothetical protein